MTHGPHEPALRDAVERCHAAIGRDRVSSALEACLCPVCMTEEVRARIVATPRRAMPIELIREYSNSAHGVPQGTDDLLVLPPRYLELIAEGHDVDHVGIGTELSRLGDALRVEPGLLTAAQRAALDAWMRALVRHVAWTDAHRRGGPRDCPWCDGPRTTSYLVPMLACGGWPATDVLAALGEAFADPEAGVGATGCFAQGAWGELVIGTGPARAIAGCRGDVPRDEQAAAARDPASTALDLEWRVAARLDWYGLERAAEAERLAVTDWLNGPAFEAAMEAVALSDELPPEQVAAGSALHGLVGRFVPEGP